MNDELIEKAKAVVLDTHGVFRCHSASENQVAELMAEFAEAYAAERIAAERDRWRKENKQLSALLCGDKTE